MTPDPSPEKLRLKTTQPKTVNPRILLIERTKKHLLSDDYNLGKLSYKTEFPDIKDKTFTPPDTRNIPVEPVLCMFLGLLKMDPHSVPHYDYYSKQALLTVILLQLVSKNTIHIHLLPNGLMGFTLNNNTAKNLTLIETTVYKRIKAVYQTHFNKYPLTSMLSTLTKRNWLTVEDLKISPHRLENVISESLKNENLATSVEGELHLPIRGARVLAKTHAFRNFYKIVKPVSRYSIEQQDNEAVMLPWGYMFGLTNKWVDSFAVTDTKNPSRILINEKSYPREKFSSYLRKWEEPMIKLGFEI